MGRAKKAISLQSNIYLIPVENTQKQKLQIKWIKTTDTYLEMSPQYHSASSSRPTMSTPFATVFDGPSTLAVLTSDLGRKPGLGCSDNLGGRGGRTDTNTTQ